MVSMRFPMPHFPCEFEIPDDWIAEAGARDFVPGTVGYLPSAPAHDAPLTQVEPPPRFSHVQLSWRGLDRERFVRVLRWMVESVPVEPVPVVEMPFVDLGSSPYKFSSSRWGSPFPESTECQKAISDPRIGASAAGGGSNPV
jgi:hypothetical protein